MIFEGLRDNFLKNLDFVLKSDSDPEKMKSKIEIERHVEIWNKMAEFMDYGVLKAPNLCEFIPIYFNRKFPSGKTYVETNEGLFVNVKDYNSTADYIQTEYLKQYHIDEWAPTLNYNHAKECEAKLLEKGSYSSINLKKSLITFESEETITIINYYGSLYNKNIQGKGKNELEAICDACNNFMMRKRGIQLNLFEGSNLEIKAIC
jgi:hypothetical protein